MKGHAYQIAGVTKCWIVIGQDLGNRLGDNIQIVCIHWQL